MSILTVPDLGCIEISQRSSLLPHCDVLSSSGRSSQAGVGSAEPRNSLGDARFLSTVDSIQASEAEAVFSVLRQSADGNAVIAIEALVRKAPDGALNRVNVLDFACKNRLAISAPTEEYIWRISAYNDRCGDRR